MNRVIKNITRSNINTIFRGRKVSLPAKHSMMLNVDNEEEKALYFHLRQTYDFIVDLTVNIEKYEKQSSF